MTGGLSGGEGGATYSSARGELAASRGSDPAIAFMKGQASLDKKSAGTSAGMIAAKPQAVHSEAAIIGSPATVAAQLNELASVPGTGGIMLIFDDFVEGTEVFGREVMPLLD
jgi:pyrimidine oxygenase